MTGTPVVAAWIAHLAFWVLLSLGIFFGELGRKSLIVILALWVVGYFGLPRLPAYGGALVAPYVALLDIALVWLVFKQDIRLS